MQQTTSQAYKAHVDELMKRSLEGDEFALKSLSALALALVLEGWRYGDPDPTDGDDDPGGEDVVELHERVMRLAA